MGSRRGCLFLWDRHMTHFSKNWTKEKQKEYEERWRADNPDYASVSARTNKYGPIWKKVFERDGNKCTLCNSDHDLCIDHILPVTKGGKSKLDNLRVLCRSCNTLEGHRGRNLIPGLLKIREYMKKWRSRNPGYFTEKSKEFRKNHIGYGTEKSNEYKELYKIALT